MRILFEVGHPAHVHLFKNAIRELEKRGHETIVASRRKELTIHLLDAYGIDHVCLSERGDGIVGLAGEQAVRELRLYRLARRFEPDAIVSRLAPAGAHVSTMTGCPNVVFRDTHHSGGTVERLVYATTAPFVDVVATPPDFGRPPGHTRHHVLGLQELAYLHPQQFTPDPAVLRSYGVDPGEPYTVLRFAAWDAYHDLGYAGFSPAAKRDLLELCADHGAVYVSSEEPLPDGFDDRGLPVPPEEIHHLLYYANLYVGDSGTMATEAAVLGTPAVRANSMVTDNEEHSFRTLEREYGLLLSFADEREAIERAKDLLNDGRTGDLWRGRRDRLLRDYPDVTERMVEIILDACRDRGGGDPE